MNLRARLALTLMAVVVVSVLGMAIGAVSSARRVPRENVDNFLKQTADEFRDVDVDTPRDLLLVKDELEEDALEAGSRPGETTVFQVVFGNGDIGVARSGAKLLPVSARDKDLSQSGGPDHLQDIRYNGANYRMITFHVDQVGAFQVARDVDDADALVRGFLPRMALWGGIGALLAGLMGWFIAGRMVRPVTELTRSSERVARTQDLTERIPVSRSDEVGRLATSFNTMMEALETSQRQQNQLVMDANHELRTPLTSLRTNIEVLQRNHRTLSDSDRQKLLRDVTDELDELTGLVSELVDSATAVDHSDAPEGELDLEELVESCAETLRRRTGRIVSVTSNGPELVVGRPALLTRAVQNLLSNAAKFSPPGTPISVALGNGRVTVSDAGDGIDIRERHQVFDRFFRSVDARSKPGSGLGLSIVREIVESHGGTVHVGESRAGGAAVGFSLPTATTETEPLTASRSISELTGQRLRR